MLVTTTTWADGLDMSEIWVAAEVASEDAMAMALAMRPEIWVWEERGQSAEWTALLLALFVAKEAA